MENNLALRPAYWASVSGGKDSLFMLNLILEHPDLYPLDGVVHFELEIDFPFIRDVVNFMEMECIKRGIRFVRIRPRNSWYDIYEEKGFPGRVHRWCNSEYKMDAQRQLNEWMKSLGCYTVMYIGYCVDEKRRYEKRADKKEMYPLVDFNIEEKYIWEWAKKQSIFNNYYKVNKRCGCMYCPLMSYIEVAYIYKYYPEKFNEFISMMRETENKVFQKTGKPYATMQGNPKYNADYIENIVKTKWIRILNEKEA